MVLAVYVVVQIAYCLWLKHQAVIDLAVVSSGFLLRAVAGGVACGLVLSQWFLLVAAFGSLFMVAGQAVLREAASRGAAVSVMTRKSLDEYSEQYLRFVWTLPPAALVTMAYSLWAFEISEEHRARPWRPSLLAPFAIGVLRYAVDIDRGTRREPQRTSCCATASCNWWGWCGSPDLRGNGGYPLTS